MCIFFAFLSLFPLVGLASAIHFLLDWRFFSSSSSFPYSFLDVLPSCTRTISLIRHSLKNSCNSFQSIFSISLPPKILLNIFWFLIFSRIILLTLKLVYITFSQTNSIIVLILKFPSNSKPIFLVAPIRFSVIPFNYYY